jgi:phosphatidylglycerophosphatase A
MRTLISGIATFGGAGYFPVAPGTLTSFLVILGYRALFHKFSWPVYLSIGLLIYVLGVWSSTKYAQRIKKEDPRTVVIDEVLGQWTALLLVPPSWGLLLLSFFLFRFFDIFKPLFIRKAETFHSGWGIMLDDVLAGLYASILLNVFLLVR